jgi:hypothetical protein
MPQLPGCRPALSSPAQPLTRALRYETLCPTTHLTKKNGAREVGRALEWTPGFLRFQ